MNANDYKELNEYLNELFIYLQDCFEPFMDIILSIFVLNDKYNKLLNDYDLNDASVENKLTFDDIYLLARKIISSLNEKYLSDFDNLIKSGELDFSYESEYYDSHFTHRNNYNFININREYNYNDVVTLVHEFFHYLTGKSGYVTNNWRWLTEFFSIYFETYAMDYLKEQGVPDDQIDYKSRLRATYNRTDSIFYFESPMLAYNFFGVVNDKSAEMLKKFYVMNVSKENFENESQCLFDWFRKKEEIYMSKNEDPCYNKYDLREYYGHLFKDYFYYFIGTVFTFYARDNCKIEDILRIYDNINDESLDFCDCLSEMQINLYDSDFDDKVIDGIKKYICDYSIEKGDKCKKNLLVKE